jgi:hypothetical protein
MLLSRSIFLTQEKLFLSAGKLFKKRKIAHLLASSSVGFGPLVENACLMTSHLAQIFLQQKCCAILYIYIALDLNLFFRKKSRIKMK